MLAHLLSFEHIGIFREPQAVQEGNQSLRLQSTECARRSTITTYAVRSANEGDEESVACLDSCSRMHCTSSRVDGKEEVE